VVTVQRYVDQDRWYVIVNGFFKYRVDDTGQRILDAAKLHDGETIPDDLYKQLRRDGHLMRVPKASQPLLLPPAARFNSHRQH
jgi:hypothetical protein